MAKKSKDTIFAEYLAELEAINPAIKDIIADEKVSAKLKEGVLARADYSSQMDSLRAERETFASEVEQARERIQGWQKWYGDVTTEVSNTQTKLKAYREAYGDLDDAGQHREAKKYGLSVEEFEKKLNEENNKRDVAALKFADDLTDIKLDYNQRFKEKLDPT
jgi:chromosome segregation ATPase